MSEQRSKSGPDPDRNGKRSGLAQVSTFFEHEAAGGIVLLVAAIVALVLANSPLHHVYDVLLETPVSVRIGALGLDKHLLHWINDGLMAVFFLLVGLEIKRELRHGALAARETALLPALAAVGGMVVPALVYAGINAGNAAALSGWAIPAATDIAFAIGVLALIGPSVPASLKVFLLALAIIDDLGAIVIIALFYTDNLSITALGLAGLGAVGLVALNRLGVRALAPYVLTGIVIWVCVLKSGVHATLAGVATALAVPSTVPGEEESPLERLEHALHPWVTFAILPLFAFANAGVSLAGVGLSQLLGTIPLGIAAGLVVGKPIGIAGASWLAVKLGLCRLPDGATWGQMLGVACLGGIGFTMSLFIGMLAFPDPAHAAELRVGVLAGSVVAAALGAGVLLRSGRVTQADRQGGLSG